MNDECTHGMGNPDWCADCRATRPSAAPREFWVADWVTTNRQEKSVAHIRHGEVCLCDPTGVYKVQPDGQGGLVSPKSVPWYAVTDLGYWQDVGNGKIAGVRRCKHCEYES